MNSVPEDLDIPENNGTQDEGEITVREKRWTPSSNFRDAIKRDKDENVEGKENCRLF